MTDRPPRLAEKLLRKAVPSGTRGLSIVGDLAQEYHARRHTSFPSLWYWRHVLGVAARYTFDARRLRIRKGSSMFDMSSDLKYALRNIRRAPGTSVTIVLTLAVAIAATTTGFSFADFALLRGMPVDDKDRVVHIYGIDPRQANGRARVSMANAFSFREQSQSLEKLSAFQTGRASLISDGAATGLDVVRCTADFFAAMGQPPLIGRLFQEGDDRPGAAPVAVLAHRYWQQIYAADPNVLGRSVILGSTPHTIVGVIGPQMEVANLSLIDMWISTPFDPMAARAGGAYSVVGRLKEGVAFETAAEEIATISTRLAADYPEANRGWRWQLVPIQEAFAGRNFWLVIALFLVTVAIIMAIACANIANLILVRATARRREMAVRSALGAGRLRLVRQLSFEGLVLSIAGGILALPFAEGILQAIRSVEAEPAFQQMRIDWHELAFIGVLVCLAPLIFSMAPAIVAMRTDMRGALQAGAMRTIGSGGASRAVLVVLQLSFASMLVIAAGFVLRSEVKLMKVDVGVRMDRVLTFGLALDAQEYPEAGAAKRVREELMRRLASLPGVESAHVHDVLPVLEDPRIVSLHLGDSADPNDSERPWALESSIDEGSLEALSVPLLAGRWLTPEETRRELHVALIGRATAERYFGSPENAIGRGLRIDDRGVVRERQIVGVVDDVLTRDLERGRLPRIWTPLGDVRRFVVVLTTHTDAAELSAPVRRAVAEVAPLVPVERLTTFAAAFERFRASDYLFIGIFSGFALLALGLAATGLYGVIAYTVSQRTAEFGTRFALGAQVSSVIALVLRDSLRLVGIGLLVGGTLGVLLTQSIRSALYELSLLDIPSLVSTTALFLFVALIATIIPALRASRVDVIQALRAE